MGHRQLLYFPEAGVEGEAGVLERFLDAGSIALETEVALILSLVIGVHQEEQVMGTYFFGIGEGLVALMEVNQPSEVLAVGGHNVVLLEVVLLSGDVASVGNVLDSQRRLQFDRIPLLLEGTEGLQLENQVYRKSRR